MDNIHPTCETCKHAMESSNKSRPWMRSCSINNQEWHKDDYCSNHSEPIPDFEKLLASERSKVIAEVRTWIKKEHYSTYDENDISLDVVDTFDLLKKLDSMDKG